MPYSTPAHQLGDIVTSTRRRQGVIYRINEVKYQTWTAQDAQYGYCQASDVGQQYPHTYKVSSIFDFNLNNRKKQRKISFTGYGHNFEKVDPQKIVELIQSLNNFVAETWP